MTGVLVWPLALLLALVTVTDLRSRLIPDLALAPAAAIALVVVAAGDPGGLAERLAWSASAGGLLLAAALITPEGMGLGDVKLAAVLGLYLGRAVAPALLIALIAGALWGAALIAVRGWEARTETIPFAPFLATGAAVAWVAADNLDQWS